MRIPPFFEFIFVAVLIVALFPMYALACDASIDGCPWKKAVSVTSGCANDGDPGCPPMAQAVTIIPTNSTVSLPSEQRACQKDEDCALVSINCSTCCPDLSNSASVNKAYAKNYEKLGLCSEEHIRSCGVPECGLMGPAAVPLCSGGLCIIVMRSSMPR